MRTNYCGKIDETLLDRKVELCGWVHRVRDLGGIIFIDLRDREGLVQIVVDPQDAHLAELGKSLHNETVIQMAGLVRLRPQGLINPNLHSGKIEVAAERLEILNRAEPLPFPINEPQEISEDLRLKYRYLDMRRKEMLCNLILRAKIVQAIHAFLNKENFLEIETPILTKSTPEGARDYLVPSRIHRGQFYALPQSPQIFKQLLMAAGVDRYYQIARCFRDEDLRADRQPEFTQLDLEMSFVTAQQVQELMESLLNFVFTEILEIELPHPIPRLTYQQTMTKYGTDKPDLRIPLELVEIKDLVKDIELRFFADAVKAEDGRIIAMRVADANKLSRKQLDGYAEFVNGFGLKNLAYLKVNDRSAGINGLQSSLLKFFSETMANAILQRVKAENGDMIFFAAGMAKQVGGAMAALRNEIGKDCDLIDREAWRPLWVVDFPLFERTNGGWSSMHHPFTAPIDTDPIKLKNDPGIALAQAYDLILNGNELGGGSIRISDGELQKAVFRILSLDEKTMMAQFGHLLNAFKYGYPPHGGIALGLDRIVMLMAKATSIRDVIPFPKTLHAACLLTKAPSKVSVTQLEELGIVASTDTNIEFVV